MKIVVNSIIPFKGYKAITLWPFVFARELPTLRTMNHESIHLRQQAETLVVFFLVWYTIEWAVRLVIYRDSLEAYRNISFEQEAYMNDVDPMYQSSRKHFAWLKYLGRKTYKKR